MAEALEAAREQHTQRSSARAATPASTKPITSPCMGGGERDGDGGEGVGGGGGGGEGRGGGGGEGGGGGGVGFGGKGGGGRFAMRPTNWPFSILNAGAGAKRLPSAPSHANNSSEAMKTTGSPHSRVVDHSGVAGRV